MIDVHALVGAYAIDALDDIERAEFERHLAECPACQAEVDGLREAAGLIGTTAATEPPAGLRDRVLADIATVRPLPPVTGRESTPAAEQAAQRGRRFRPRLVAAAAAAVIALGGGAVVVDQVTDDTSQGQLTAADRIRAADDAQTYRQSVKGGGRATVIRSRELNEAVLVTDGMPAAPNGSVYELWLIQGDDMVSAGLMTGGSHQIVLEGDAASAAGFGITVEPDGGSAKPTLPPVAQIAFENT